MMNNFKHTQMVTYFYLKNLREMLDFAYEGRNKKKEEYDQKKKIFEQAIGENGILENFVFKSNPEQKDKIKEKYEDFMYDVFNDRVISFENDKMIFDVAQKLNFFKSIFETRELFQTIAISQINYGRKTFNEEYDAEVEKLVVAEDIFYRSLFTLLLEVAVRDTFLDYVKEMNESKGQPNPQINFITNILGQYLQLATAIMNNNVMVENEYFDEAKHCFKTAIDAITGKLGKKNLQEQENYFIRAREAVDKSLIEAEKNWITLFNPLVKETIEFEKKSKEN